MAISIDHDAGSGFAITLFHAIALITSNHYSKKIPAGSIPAGEKELLPYSAATSIVTGILFAKR